MSKAVLISIRPKWVEKIANGEKTIEIRKNRPKLATPFKCYIYCSAGGDKLWVRDAAWRERWMNGPIAFLVNAKDCGEMNLGNGRIIGDFTCDRIYELAPLNHAPDDVEKQACLTREEIVNYLKGTGYGWHISDLLIYDRPRELTDFRRICPNDLCCETCAMYSNNGGICNNGALPLRRPPQSWCYVEAMKNE